MKGIIYAFLAMISYSSTPTFTQVGYRAGIRTNTLLFSRHLVSLICLLPSVLKRETFEGITRKQIPGLLILSAFAVIGNITFNYAYHYLPNMVAISVSLSYIVFVFVIEMIIGRETYSPKRLLIVSLTFLGLIIIAVPGAGGQFPIKAFIVGIIASLMYSTQVILISSENLRPVHTNVILLTGVIPIMIYSSIRCLALGEPLLPSGTVQWISIICMGTIGVIVARGLFYRSMKIIGATTASMIDSLEPLSSAVLGYVLLNQGLSLYIVLGSLLMMLSTIMLLKEKKPSEQSSSEDR